MLERAIGRIVRTLNYVGMGLLFALMCLTTVDAGGRYLFNRPLRGTLEITQIVLAVIVFLGLSYTAVLRGHISVDLLTAKMSPKTRAVLDVMNNAVGIAIFLLIAWQGLDVALHARAYGETTDILGISLFPSKLFVPIGAILLCIVLAIHILQSLGQIVRRG